MEKAFQLHTHIDTDSVKHTVAARDTAIEGQFLANQGCFSAIVSRLKECTRTLKKH